MGCSTAGTPPSNNTDEGSGLAGAIGRRFRDEILPQFIDNGVEYEWADDQFYTFIAQAVADAFVNDCTLGSVTNITETRNGNGITTSVVLDFEPLENSVKAFVGGLRATPVAFFNSPGTALEVTISGDSVTFGAAPGSGSDIVIDYSTQEDTESQ